MNYLEFYDLLCQGELVSQNWKYVLQLISGELKGQEEKDAILKVFVVYFSLVEDGNTYLSLEEEELKRKIEEKIARKQIQDKENEQEQKKTYDQITTELKEVYPVLCEMESLAIVGKNSLFCVENQHLYMRKYFRAKEEVLRSIERLYCPCEFSSDFDYHTYVDDSFQLTKNQEDVIKKGLNNNLMVTGGPGTGKTTSIFFLLIALLEEGFDGLIYLTAPSGKAASRMKESILNNIRFVKPEKKDCPLIQEISHLEEYTIHRLLHYNPANNMFDYSKYSTFPENSIFIVDEASMVDVCLFASLLQAIPTGARVFIMGDKNQLPSVECGAVFAELLTMLSEKGQLDNIVELVESKRFSSTTDIYNLSEAINHGEDLPVTEEDWATEFVLHPPAEKGTCPIYYFLDTDITQAKIEEIAKQWYDQFYSTLQEKCVGLKETDVEVFDSIFSIAENARILCADNRSVRGTHQINRCILKQCYDASKKTTSYFTGELLMITKNDKALDLYNGDCGVSVMFENDDTLYLMFKKTSNLFLDGEKHENKIFKLGEYVFYPVRMIEREKIVSAFAITIHKSQGSDYNNILVILPKLIGHPLLNRQIVYTAITRTKGNTYIISNQENLECARDYILIRDTGIYN